MIYKKRERAIPYESKKRLIGIPILVTILLTLIIPVFLKIVENIFFQSDFETSVSIPSTISMILTVIISLLVITKIGKITLNDLGFESKDVFVKIFTGIISGFIAISLLAFAITQLGGVTMTFNFQPEYSYGILIGIVFFTFQGTYEEIIYRGYLMPHFSKSMGIFFSIIVSSILFTLLHSLNPGMTIIPILNLFLASVAFSLVYYKWGNMWLCGFAHAVWNFSQGFIYGSLVSGNHLENTVFVATPVKGKALISGGDFGFEGGLIMTCLAIIIIILTFLIKRANVKVSA